MWTDDEINWSLGENLKIEGAVENMRIQATERGNGKEVVVIISSLDSKTVLYEGQSKDYCATFTEKTKVLDWHFQMPVVTFAIINGSLVGASSMEYIQQTSGQQEAESSAKRGEGSPVDGMKESLPETDEPVKDETGTLTLENTSEDSVEVSFQNVPEWALFGKAARKVTNAISFIRKSSRIKSTQQYESVSKTEVSSVNNEKSMEHVIKESLPETNELTDDEKESESVILEESALIKKELTGNTIKEGPSETNKLRDDEHVMLTMGEQEGDSMEGSLDNFKKQRSLGRLVTKITNKLPTKSKRESPGSKLTKESESASLTEESSFIKEELAGNKIRKGLSETNKLKDDEGIVTRMEEPPETTELADDKRKSESVMLEESVLIKEELTGNTIIEGSSETNKLTDDVQVVLTMKEQQEDSMEGSSDNFKKSLGRFVKKVTNKLPTKSKGKSPGSKLTKESESASLTEESSFIKEESTGNKVRKGLSETNKLKDNKEIETRMEEPPKTNELTDDEKESESVTREESALIKKELTGNTIKEGSSEIDKLTDDELVMQIMEEQQGDSMEGSSDNLKKQSSLGRFVKKVTNKLPTKSKTESHGSKLTKESESASLTEKPLFIKEESAEYRIKKGSSETTKLKDDKEIVTKMEEPPETNELTDDEKESECVVLEESALIKKELTANRPTTIVEKPPEYSMEGSSDKVKEWSSFGRVAKKVSNKLSTKSKRESSGSKLTKYSESASLTDDSSFIKEESAGKSIREGSSESNKVTDDEQVMPTMEAPHGDAMEDIAERVKKQSSIGRLARTVSNKLLTKLKSESYGSKLTREPEIEVTSNAEGSQIQDRSTWEGLWHLEQDTTNDKAIRLKPVKDNKISLDTTYDFVTILENRSKVQCEQILPFTCKDKSWFLMIYKTHYINDKDDEQNHSLCTRYHVFSLDKMMGGI
ncbi:uncharacterized protein LOC117121695 [Anneissia japonica]|uniref:uncharacterized protein LOC117121695 n=1 Tax=Anneissia japonica TaxID=1529436 RepID=UPI00142570B9|nr:uncharacterized protein LOC117121695 [Anneissia japonica]